MFQKWEYGSRGAANTNVVAHTRFTPKLALGLLACLCVFVQYDKGGSLPTRHLTEIARSDIELDITGITPFQDICPEEYPPSHSTLHDSRQEEQENYNTMAGRQNELWNNNADLPGIHEYHNYMYAVWRSPWCEASAWSPTVSHHVEGPGWVEPTDALLAKGYENGYARTLKGDYVAYHSWFLGNFGHFAHDWLPTIALLRHIVPESTKFLLADNANSRRFLEFLDPDFYNKRVVWIQQNEIYNIKGKLTLNVPAGIPNVFGCCTDWDPLRQWIAEKHPERPTKEFVIFYTRDSSDVTGGRVLSREIEAQAIARIQKKLKEYGRHETVFVFSGQDATGKTLSIMQQFELFRNASAFIGPHGSGLGGNFLWMDPFASTCDERPQILEFMPGPRNPDIHALYASYYSNLRKWPFDYHTMLYVEPSNGETTYIDLDTLDDALDAMWGTSSDASNAIEEKIE